MWSDLPVAQHVEVDQWEMLFLQLAGPTFSSKPM
jgi:hypothetical protein